MRTVPVVVIHEVDAVVQNREGPRQNEDGQQGIPFTPLISGPASANLPGFSSSLPVAAGVTIRDRTVAIEDLIRAHPEFLKFRASPAQDERYGQTAQGLIHQLKEAAACRLLALLSDSPAGFINSDHFGDALRRVALPFSDEFRFNKLLGWIRTSRDTVLALVRDALREMEHGSGQRETEREFVTGPALFRAAERDSLLIPSLERLLKTYCTSHPIPEYERTLFDAGAATGALSLGLQQFFGRIVGFEPDTGRWSKLHAAYSLAEWQSRAEDGHGTSHYRNFEAYNLDIRTVAEDPKLVHGSADIVLCSHVLDLLKSGEDERVLRWAIDALRTGGRLIAVLNDMVPDPGTGAHLRAAFSAGPANSPAIRYQRFLEKLGASCELYTPCLRFTATGEEGLRGLKELMFYCIPGEARYDREKLDRYVAQHVKDRCGPGQHVFDHRVAILVADKGLACHRRSNRDAGRCLDSDGVRPVTLTRGPEPLHRPAAALDADELWRAYKNTLADDLRNALVELYLPIVKYNAERIHARMPEEVEADDLVSAGTFGLIDAIRGFDLSRGIKFETYCVPRIRGAMLDGLRSMDFVPRLVRQRARKVQEAVKALTVDDRPPGEEELARYLEISPAELEEYLRSAEALVTSQLSKKFYETDSFKDVTLEDQLVDPRAPQPPDRMQRWEFWKGMLRGLSKSERLAVILYHYEEWTMKDTGKELDLSESRVSQMMTGIYERWRQRMQQNRGRANFSGVLADELKERIWQVPEAEPEIQPAPQGEEDPIQLARETFERQIRSDKEQCPAERVPGRVDFIYHENGENGHLPDPPPPGRQETASAQVDRRDPVMPAGPRREFGFNWTE